MRDIVFDKMLCHAFVFGNHKNYLHFFLQSSIIVKMSLNDLFYYIASFIAVVAVLTMHEFPHAEVEPPFNVKSAASLRRYGFDLFYAGRIRLGKARADQSE